MMRSLIKMVTLLLAFHTFILSNSMAQTTDADLYPYLPMAKIYRQLAKRMTDRLIEQIPEATEHKARILSFVFSRTPVNSFEKMMTTDPGPLKNDKGQIPKPK